MYYLVYLTGASFLVFRDKKLRLYNLFILLIVLMAIFRYGVGIDYFNYENLFDVLKPSIIDEYRNPVYNQELLFRLFGFLIKKIGFDYRIYIGLLAIIQLFFVDRIIRSYSVKPIQSLFIYYCFFYFVWTFSGLRQGITISAGIYFYFKYINSRKTLKFILITLILSLIHVSAVILIPVYLLVNSNIINRKILCISSVISFGFSMLPIGIIISRLSFLPIINEARSYLGNTSYSFFNAFNFQSIARLCFLILVLVHYKKVSEDNNYKIVIDTYVVFMNIYFVLKYSELLAGRLSIYGFVLLILILPKIVNTYKIRLNRLAIVIMFLILALLYLQKELVAMEVSTLSERQGFLVPYTNIYNHREYSFLMGDK